MGMLKSVAMLVALLVVGIGIVGKTMPEIFLKIPNVGFIFFMLLGGNNGILPPYFDITMWQGDNHREWLRDGDVVVATAAKAGTTWMCYCTDAIRRKGSDEVGLPYTDIMLSTPWFELPQQPGQTWAERKELYNTSMYNGRRVKDYWDNAAFPFRVFKSHYTPIGGPGKTDVLPVKERPNVKYIIAFRNPFEVAKSIHSFFPKHEDDFQKMWGGFPPHFPNAEAAMKELLPGGQLQDLFFGYVKGWWPHIKLPNVLALHFTDNVKDVPGMVDKVAKFVGVSLNSDEKAKVVEKCGFAHMKANADQFNYQMILNTVGVKQVMKSGGIINKGKSGSAEDGISEEAMKEFSDAIDRELTDPKLKKFALEGGEI